MKNGIIRLIKKGKKLFNILQSLGIANSLSLIKITIQLLGIPNSLSLIKIVIQLLGIENSLSLLNELFNYSELFRFYFY